MRPIYRRQISQLGVMDSRITALVDKCDTVRRLVIPSGSGYAQQYPPAAVFFILLGDALFTVGIPFGRINAVLSQLAPNPIATMETLAGPREIKLEYLAIADRWPVSRTNRSPAEAILCFGSHDALSAWLSERLPHGTAAVVLSLEAIRQRVNSLMEAGNE